MIIYADVLLLVNLSMDILCLYIVGSTGHKKMTSGRIACSALVGATAATTMTLFPFGGSRLSGILNIIVGVGISIIMTRIAFDKPTGVAMLIRDSVMLWGSGALIGGIMSIVLSMGEPMISVEKPNFTLAFTVVAVAAVFAVRLFTARGSRRSVEIRITSASTSYSLSALCDSGSFAVEPISGLPVIIAKSYSLPGISDELHSGECSLRLRMIPVKGIGGESLMYGFIPDKIEVDGRDVSAVVAIDENRGTFAEHTAIVPLMLCKKN